MKRQQKSNLIIQALVFYVCHVNAYLVTKNKIALPQYSWIQKLLNNVFIYVLKPLDILVLIYKILKQICYTIKVF